jgi:hypothetical protein
MTNIARPPGRKTTMNKKPPDELLRTAATALYGAPAMLTTQAKQIAECLIDGVLSAATAGGYRQADILATLLARCTPSRRVYRMTREACSAAGTEALQVLFDRLGLADITAWPA